MFCQDTSAAWLTNIDSAKFKIYYKKRAIPRDFYQYVGIDNLSEIVSANKRYRQGCVGRLPGNRLNWLAKDNNNHWVLSVSFGGKAHGTKYIYIDRDKNSYNVNGFRFFGADRNDLTLGRTIQKIRDKQYFRISPAFLGVNE